jgi:hypothetical protein
MEAYKTHSLGMESGIPPPCKRTKRECWESSNKRNFTCTNQETHGTELFQGRQMASGIHSWSIKVVKMCDGCWLGVALATDPPDRNAWLGKQATGWVFGSNGSTCHATHQDNGPYNYIHPVYEEGSILKFRLDLTQQGTLSASVDGGEERLLFDNMLMIGEEKADRSFVPAVSLIAPGAVRFLGFHRGGKSSKI